MTEEIKILEATVAQLTLEYNNILAEYNEAYSKENYYTNTQPNLAQAVIWKNKRILLGQQLSSKKQSLDSAKLQLDQAYENEKQSPSYQQQQSQSKIDADLAAKKQKNQIIAIVIVVVVIVLGVILWKRS